MIRHATLDDVDQMVILGRHMHQESIYRDYNYDDYKVGLMMTTVITNDAGVAIVSTDETGVVNGGIIGWVSDHWFGHGKMLCDLAFFLDTSARSGMTAYRLIKSFIQYGKDFGCNQTQLSNSSGYETDRVAKLYQRSGMEHVGYVYSIKYERE